VATSIGVKLRENGSELKGGEGICSFSPKLGRGDRRQGGGLVGTLWGAKGPNLAFRHVSPPGVMDEAGGEKKGTER